MSKPKTSIIIAVWNALPFTMEAVESVRQYTEDFELIIVDNGSRPDTVDWLRTLPSMDPRIKVIFNERNLGPGAAFNQGILASRGEFICLLNSDAKATNPCWIERMIEVAKSDQDIGIVGPLCNNISSIQTLMDLAKYNQHVMLPKGYVMPFVCVVMPRWVFTKRGVGLIAERFRMGCSEDTEFCQRLDKAKLLKAVAGQSFVFHALSQSYKDNGVNSSTAVREMEKLGAVVEDIRFLPE